MDPTTQTAIASIVTATIATSGVVATAVINNRRERTKAADAGVEAGLSDQDVLKLVADLIAENARKEAALVKSAEEKAVLVTENEDLKKKLAPSPNGDDTS